MSNLLNEATTAETQASALVNEALDEIDAGAEAVEGMNSFFSCGRSTGNKRPERLNPHKKFG